MSVLKGLPIASKNPVKRTSGAFAVKEERARCRKKLVVAACRPRDQAVKVLITSRRMVSMMLGAHAVHPPPQPNRTPLCCITLGIYSSICRHLAKYRLGGWSLPGPRGPWEEKERSWPTIDREWEGWEVVKWGEERVYVVYRWTVAARSHPCHPPYLWIYLTFGPTQPPLRGPGSKGVAVEAWSLQFFAEIIYQESKYCIVRCITVKLFYNNY